MAITHVKGDFGPEHFSRSFGFHGSAESDQPSPQRGGSPPFAGNEPTRGPKSRPEPMEMGEQTPGDFAKGGAIHPHHHPHGHHVAHVEHRHDGVVIEHHSHGGMTHHHPDGHVTHHHHDGSHVAHHATGGAAHHMHPHGHHVVHVEHREHDGAVVHHHHHGGHSVHHADGRITHHHPDGSPVHDARGGGIEHMHDPEGEYAHRARGGGEHEEHLRRGGMAHLPHGMKPPGMRPHSPIETPPRNPNMTTTPRNMMPAGEMGYGVEPSAEPDMAGSEQGISQLRRGGRAKHRKE